MQFHIPGTEGAMIPPNIKGYVNAFTGNFNLAQNPQGPVSSHEAILQSGLGGLGSFEQTDLLL